MTAQEMTDKIAESGPLEFKFHLLKDGTYRGPSLWSVSLIRGQESYTTDYTMGAAFRLQGRRFGGATRHRVRFPYGKMTIHEQEVLERSVPEPPKMLDVLWSLAMDTSGVAHGETFEDWCSDYGYDTDSRKAYKMFNACRDTSGALLRLDLDWEMLSEETEEIEATA